MCEKTPEFFVYPGLTDTPPFFLRVIVPVSQRVSAQIFFMYYTPLRVQFPSLLNDLQHLSNPTTLMHTRFNQRYFDELIMPDSRRNSPLAHIDGEDPPKNDRPPRSLHQRQQPDDRHPSDHRAMTKEKHLKGNGGFTRSDRAWANLQTSAAARRGDSGVAGGAREAVARCVDLKLSLKERLDK